MHFLRFITQVCATGIHIFQSLPIFASTLSSVNFVNFESDSVFRGISIYFSQVIGINFVWSGLLGFKGRYSELIKTGRINFTKNYIHRLLRVVPTLFGCHLLILSFPRNLMSGPIWRETTERFRKNCINNWWRELTFTQNLCIDSCLVTSWIVGPDLEFFTVSFVLIFLYHWRPKVAHLVLIAFIFLGIVLEALYRQVNGYRPLFDLESYDLERSRNEFGLLVNPINYISSYSIGIFLGIILHEKWKVSKSDMKWFPFVYWSTTLSIIAMTYIIPNSWKTREPSNIEKVIYGCSFRTLVAISFAAIIYWVFTFKDSFLNLLNFRVLAILSQLNFSYFMSHLLITYLDIASLRQPLEYSIWSFIVRTTYVFVLGVILGFVMYILFEAPFIQLSIYLFSGKSKIMYQKEHRDINENNEEIEMKQSDIIVPSS